jgi:site-specific recombinase XerC
MAAGKGSHVLRADAYDRPTYEDIRNRALVACYMATRLRLREVLKLPHAALDRVSGKIKFIRGKGNKPRQAWLLHTAMKHVKAYLRIRPTTAADERLWLKADGTPLTVYALHAIIWSLRARERDRSNPLAPVSARLRPDGPPEGRRQGHGPGDAGPLVQRHDQAVRRSRSSE